jgi:hypothetical protein
MITRLRYPKGYQFFDANGAPLALGNIYYYVAGTTTPQDTYADSAGTVVNTNPIILDGSGRLDADVYLGSGANYKEVLTTASATVSPWPDDNIPLAAQADWNAGSGPNQILNKPALATVALSGSYTDLSDTPAANNPFTGDNGTGGADGLVPAPAAGDAVANKFLSASGAWAIPPGAGGSGATNLTITESASNVGIGSSSGSGVTIPAATATAAGVLDAARATKIDGLATVATSGSYADLSNKPSIPSIPSALSGQDIDNVARVGINTIDTANALSVNGPSVLFSNSGDMHATLSKGAAPNTAAIAFQDNYSTRAQFGLIGNDSFTISTSPNGSTFNSAIVATTGGEVTFPNTGGFSGDAGSGGSTGLVPAPAAGASAAGKFLKADGSWSVPPGTATTMSGATSTSSGAPGLVPTPSAGQQGTFLRGDGAWVQMSAAQVSELAPSATIDTTNASNIVSGTLAAGRVADLSGSYVANSLKGANNGVATLDASGKLNPEQIPASLVGAVVYQGAWNAATNTPALVSGVGVKGNYYKVSTAGTASIDGINQWSVGDTIIFDGTTWDKLGGDAPEVLSVAGLTGTVSAAGLKSALAITASDVSGLAASATVDTTNASNIVSGTLPAAQLPVPTSSTLGGVQAAMASSNQFMTGINTSGAPQFAQPAAANISGLAASATTDTTNAANITSGTLAAARLPSTAVQALNYSGSKTYNIKHDGSGDFADVRAALVALQTLLPISTVDSSDKTVVLQLDAGVHNYSSVIYPLQPYSQYINITGVTPTQVSVTSIQSSSGSSGAWSIVLNVSSAAGISTSDYAVIYGTSGGTNPTYIEGCWPITAVDAVNNRVTISTTHQASAAPSGAVICSNFFAMHTILKFNGCDGFRMWNMGAVLNIANVAIVGDGVTGESTGINCQDGCRVNMYGGLVGVCAFTFPVYLNLCSHLANGVIVASSSYGAGTNACYYVDSLAVVDVSYMVGSGAIGASGDGIYSLLGARVRATTSTFSGNGNAGVLNSGAYLVGTAINCTGNGGPGFYNQNGGWVPYISTINAVNNGGSNLTCDYGNGSWTPNGTPIAASFGATSTSASYPAFVNKQDFQTGLGFPSAGTAIISAGGVEKARWTSNGMGIGGVAPTSGIICDVNGPVRTRSSTLLGTPVAGTWEFDGNAPYFSPAASVRGIVPAIQYSKVSASGGVTLANSASAQSFLPSGAQNFPVVANTRYKFKAKLLVSKNVSNSASVSFLLANGGSSAFSWGQYLASCQSSSSASGGNSSNIYQSSAMTATVVTPANTNQYDFITIEGDFVMSAGGTIQPQIQFSTAPGGSGAALQGSYFELFSFGTNAASGGLS